MFAPRVHTKLCSPKQAVQLTRVVTPLLQTSSCSSPSLVGLRLSSAPSSTAASLSPSPSPSPSNHRSFSTTRPALLRDFFPAKETAHIRLTPPAWPHHGYTEAEMLAVVPGHRKPVTWGDKIAWALIRTSRWCMDKATGMSKEQKTDKKKPTTAVIADKPLTETQWVGFLEPQKKRKRKSGERKKSLTDDDDT